MNSQSSVNRHLCFLSAAFIFIFSFPCLSQAGDNSLPVEGIVYEPRDPAKSFAVIDGNIYKKGEKYQTYEVTEVRQDRVVVKNTWGQTSEHRIKGGTHPAAVAPPVPETVVQKPLTGLPPQPTDQPQTMLPVQNTPPAASAKSDALLEQVKKIFESLDIAAIMNYASELSVMTELRGLYSRAATAAMMEEGSEVSLDKMIKDGLLGPQYKEGKNGYHYRIQMTAKGPEVFADPMKGETKSRHFMVDTWGNMRVEQGQSATEKSPLMQPPAWLKGLVPKTTERQTPHEYTHMEQESGAPSKM